MLKIIDVDWVKDYALKLLFSDGLHGQVDLSDIFSRAPFVQVKDFTQFSLTPSGCLRWGENELNAHELRALVTEKRFFTDKKEVDVSDIEEVLKQASWESMKEGRPDILQAAIRSYVERYGHAQVIAKAGIKSRTSAYRSLKPETRPNFATLVQLGHAVIELARTEQLRPG